MTPAFHLVSVTRIVVLVRAGTGTMLALTNRDGDEELNRLLRAHEGAPVLYDGPPNRESGYKAGKKNRQHETMTSLVVGKFGVRVWCTADRLAVGPDRHVSAALERLGRDATVMTIAEMLDHFDYVAAYEILDCNGNGGIVYPDWK